jgi:hypothetical protein
MNGVVHFMKPRIHFFSLACVLPMSAALHAEMTIATVGDSLADAVYLGIKSQPQLVKDNQIHLIRWSRPSIGLTRLDFFDYPGWLRSKDLGRVDFCVVELGANDLQSISVGRLKWIAVGTERWQQIYQQRQEQMMETLKTDRCAEVVWLLQPGYEQNKYLRQYHHMINTVQLTGLQSSKTAAFEITAEPGDYTPDGIHFNGPFALKLGQAVVKVFTAWKQYVQSCSGCHATTNYSELAPRQFAPLLPRTASRTSEQ